MAEKKRQHYVPQLLLRRFSKNGTTTSLVRLADWKVLEDIASIASQCQEDYFYGKDLAWENAFGVTETKLGGYLKDLSPKALAALASDEVAAQLRLYALYQEARTPGAAEHLSRFQVGFMKAVLKQQAILNNGIERADGSRFTAEDIDAVELSIKDAHLHALEQCLRTTPIVSDLAVTFIVTERTPGFVLGDHPVASYNQFAEQAKGFPRSDWGLGHAVRGLQMFLPLSPGAMLAIYDPGAYEYVRDKAGVCRATAGDVEALNRIQAINALERLYYRSDRINAAALADLRSARRAHPSIFAKRTTLAEMVPISKEKATQRIESAYQTLRIGARLSCVRIKKQVAFYMSEPHNVPVRSPELIELARQYSRLIDRKIAAQQSSE